VEKTLDELLRVTRPGARLFLHSECGDYRDRWPDRMLKRKLGYDHGARLDGHVSLLSSADLRALVARRFTIERAWSPAGFSGWLTGHQDKYRTAFSEARCRGLALLTAVFSFIKRFPLTGFPLRLFNASLNHLELALGLQGGGSLFMQLTKPETDRTDQPISQQEK
jgi:hypothetical protein